MRELNFTSNVLSTHDGGKELAANYQVIKSYSLILKCYISLLILGVWIHQLQVAGGNLPSIPHSLKHTPHCPPHTGSTFCMFLSWPHHEAKFLQDGSSVEGREGKEGHQGWVSWVSWSTKAFLSSLRWSLSTGIWKAEIIENWSKLTVRTSACWLLCPLRWADRPGGRCLHPDTQL